MIAAYGRGIWTYDFENAVKPPTPPSDVDEPPARVDPNQTFEEFTFEETDGGPSGWTSAVAEDPQGAPVPWTYGAPGMGADGSSDGTVNAWSLDGESGMYVDKQDSVLLSPPITTQREPTVLQFGMLLDTEAGFDEVSVQFHPAGETTGEWTSLASYSGQFPVPEVVDRRGALRLTRW